MRLIDRLQGLGFDELKRIRATLFRRYGIGQRGNVIEVAFGAAEKQSKFDPDRLDAICFYVRYKRLPRDLADRIPPIIDVRIRRGKNFALVRLPSDVIHLGPRQIQPSGRLITHRQSRLPALTGCVVAWQSPQLPKWTWGLLSVGHTFQRVSRVPESQQRVQITSATLPAHRFKGTLLARTLPRDGSQIDASLTLVNHASLVRAMLMPPNDSMVGKWIREVPQLITDRTKSGYSFPVATKVPLAVARYLPVSNLVPALGPLQHVVEVIGENHAFQRGWSGALWTVENQVACIQQAGLSPNFNRGWGQSLAAILDWALERLTSIYQVPKMDIDLRLIRII